MTAFTFCIRERPGDSLVRLWGRREARSVDGEAPGAVAGPRLAAVFAELARGMLAPRGLVLFGLTALTYGAMSVFGRACSFDLIRSLGWTDEQSSVCAGR